MAVLRKKPGESRAYEKSKAERNTDQTKSLRPILRFGHVRNVSLRDGQVARSKAIDDSREKDKPQRTGKGEHQKSDKRSDLTHQQDRSPADTIGQLSQRRAGNQLTQRIRGNKHSDDRRRGSQRLRVKRKQREDNRQTHHIDENN